MAIKQEINEFVIDFHNIHNTKITQREPGDFCVVNERKYTVTKFTYILHSLTKWAHENTL